MAFLAQDQSLLLTAVASEVEAPDRGGWPRNSGLARDDAPGLAAFAGAFRFSHAKAITIRNESQVHSIVLSSTCQMVNARWVLCVSGDVFEDVCTSGE